jgi:hypothetical protein
MERNRRCVFTHYTFRFTREMKDDRAGLLAAAFIGIVPGYISRSVAGSYDNEAIAIFLLMFTFYLWIKALKLGSALFGMFAALFYFYMVAAWGMCVVFQSITRGSRRCRWLRVHYQHDPSSRAGPHHNGPLQQPPVCCVFDLVRRRHTCQHAGPLCGLPACPHK